MPTARVNRFAPRAQRVLAIASRWRDRSVNPCFPWCFRRSATAVVRALSRTVRHFVVHRLCESGSSNPCRLPIRASPLGSHHAAVRPHSRTEPTRVSIGINGASSLLRTPIVRRPARVRTASALDVDGRLATDAPPRDVRAATRRLRQNPARIDRWDRTKTTSRLTSADTSEEATQRTPSPRRRAPEGFDRWRKESAIGGVGTGIARGLQAVFAPPADEIAIVAEVPGEPPDADTRLRVILDPDDPTKSIAVVPAPPADPPPGAAPCARSCRAFAEVRAAGTRTNVDSRRPPDLPSVISDTCVRFIRGAVNP